MHGSLVAKFKLILLNVFVTIGFIPMSNGGLISGLIIIKLYSL